MPVPVWQQYLRRPVKDLTARVEMIEATRRVWSIYALAPAPRYDVNSGVAQGVVSAAFVDVWVAAVPQAVGPCVDVGLYLYLPTAAEDGEVRLRFSDADGDTYSAVGTLTAGGGATWHAMTALWLHGKRTWAGAAEVAFQARRTAGGPDPVWVYEMTRFSLRDPEGATSGPTWTEVVS